MFACPSDLVVETESRNAEKVMRYSFFFSQGVEGNEKRKGGGRMSCLFSFSFFSSIPLRFFFFFTVSLPLFSSHSSFTKMTCIC